MLHVLAYLLCAFKCHVVGSFPFKLKLFWWRPLFFCFLWKAGLSGIAIVYPWYL